MEYKPDWPRAKARWEAFWRGERLPRPIMMVTAPLEAEGPPFPPPAASLVEQWLDPKRIVAQHEATFARTYHAGEAVPVAYANLGPCIAAAFLGCPVTLHSTTVWLKPVLRNLNHMHVVDFDRENRWWKKLCEITQALQEAGKDRFMVGLTDLHGPADHLAALRGSQQLCIDIVERPDEVMVALERCLELYWKILCEHGNQIARTHEGSSNWQRWWAPGRSEVLQEDFADLISLEHYRRFIQQIDIQLACLLDHSVFHIHHTMPRLLPGLLEIEDLDAVQWAGLPNSDSLEDGLPFMQMIQGAGKAIYMGAKPEQVECLIKSLDPDRLMLCIRCKSAAEADALLEQAEKWTEERRREGNMAELKTPKRVDTGEARL